MVIQAKPPPCRFVSPIMIANDTCQSLVVHFRQAWPSEQVSGYNGIAQDPLFGSLSLSIPFL